MRRPTSLAVLFLLTACIPAPPVEEEPGFVAAERMAEWLSGTFDSEQQSLDDPRYFPIRLDTCPVEAPQLGATAVYIEQAMIDSLDAPYRQRIYVIESETSDEQGPVARTVVHTLADEAGAVGLCGRDDVAVYGSDDVVLRRDCDVVAEWDAADEVFVGGTRGEDCASSLQGARYATSEVRVEPDLLESWDRGFDAEGQQVWGAVDGPYEFVRTD
jgi:hypothetical protein